MPNNLTLAQAMDLLEQQENIAQYLLDCGYVYVPTLSRSHNCPVAQYMTAQTGEDCGGNMCEFYYIRSYILPRYSSVPCTPRVSKFINEFDSGLHSELMSSV